MQGREQVGPEGDKPLAGQGLEPLLLQQGLTALRMPEGLMVMGGANPQGQAPIHGGAGGLAVVITQAGGAEQPPHMHGRHAIAAA